MRLIVDIETNALKNPSVIHCVVAHNLDTGVTHKFVGEEVNNEFPQFIKDAKKVIGHNFLSYDLDILRRLAGCVIPDSIVLDTLILSHLLHFGIDGGHSLEAWGARFRYEKVGKDVDFQVYSPTILERCKRDVEINTRLYKLLESKLNRPEFKDAIEVEHRIALVCKDMHASGFPFDGERARSLRQELSDRVKALDQEILEICPPKIKTVELKTKTKTLVIPFNPNSHTQMVERLDEWGWQPTEKTESGKSFKVNEVNLATLPESAPPAAKKLVERTMLESRVRTLTTWLENYNEDTCCVHGQFHPIGTWTHRMAHREPNLGNVAAEKSIKYHTQRLRELAIDLGGKCRSLWRARDGYYLVGCDAESIQLRVFAHYINDPAFTKALISGKKEDGSDPHSLNAKILGCSRDSAKTFIYAFLLGAGDAKLGEILSLDSRKGRERKQQFIEAYPGLERLREETIPKDARRGYFQGFDGRLVACSSEHLMLAGYLQNGEAVIMKHANVEWRTRLLRDAVPFWQRNFVHDEWQTETDTERNAHRVGRTQAEAIRLVGERFRLNCPMAGNYNIGKNWLDTH